jgi:uncharacterized protein (TIGR00255 family)
MVYSMTGFGRADSQDGQRRVTVEVRSVNHRFREVSIRLPRVLSALEQRVQEKVQERVLRGKINITVNLTGEVNPVVSLSIDEALAERYLQIAQDLKTRYGLRGDLDAESFITLPNLLVREEQDFSKEEGWVLIEPPLTGALDALAEMREIEGQQLERDLRQRTAGILSAVERVAVQVPTVVDNVRTRLRDRLAEISEDVEYNNMRLEAELTMFADRADITEECVRLRSHCEQFDAAMESPEPAGRKLKFLLEEMHREVNTIGSKGQATEISRDVIFMKEEIEKIREQVLNIE